VTQVTATKCDACGVVREGYVDTGWLTLELNRMPLIDNKAHFCSECAPDVIDVIRRWIPDLGRVQSKMLALPPARASVGQDGDG
jgi:hypothetical protein